LSKLRITPIGTCRIHSPLRRAAARYPIEIDLRRNYGFVHTSEEALQQIEFLLGEKDFAPAVAPLIMRDGKDGDYYNQTWEPADLHLVEISSAKSITCGGEAVQSNYLYRHFADFFANSLRARTYWNLVKKGHRGRLSAYLREQPSFRMLHSSERDLLLSMSIEQQSFKSVKSGMERIVDRLGADRVLFVTHVNALTPDEERIPSRDRLIRWVTLAAEQIGVGVFDPTASMLEFGQDRALEKAGLDLTHYTPAFFEKLYDDLHASHIGAIMQARLGMSDAASPNEDQIGLLASNFETMLEISDFFATSKQIHEALEKAPDALPLVALRGLIRSRIGDSSNAVSDFDRSENEIGLSLPVRTAMVEAYAEVGNYAKSLEIAEGLIGDEFASAQIYAAAARAAALCGKSDAALRHAKQAFRLDREDLGIALDALKLLSDRGDPEAVAEWRTEVLENAAESSNGAFEICVWAIENRDEELFTTGLKSIALRDKGSTIDLLEDALKAGMDRAVADCIPALMAIGRVSRVMADRRSAILTGLLARAETLIETRKLDDAFHVSSAILDLLDVESSQVPTRKLAVDARRLVREIVKDMRVTVRDAYARRDMAAILEARDAAGSILIDEPDVAVIVGRSLFTAGREDDALALIKRVYDRHPDHVQAMRWTGRLAAGAGDYTVAIRAYGQLRSQPDDLSRPFEAEMDRFFAVAGRRALKQLRAFVEAEDFDNAVALAAEIQRHDLDVEGRAERELNRLYRSLRMRLKDIDEGEGEIEERELVLRQMTRLNPGDESILRRLALELMRQFRFAEAAEIWERLFGISPDNESAERNLERCRRLAARRSSTPSPEAEAAP
jgi:tetratricopeptide (TPR) repeat protein